MGEAAVTAAGDAEDPGAARPLIALLHEGLQAQLKQRPYATVLVAAAAGYVLGGGAPSWAVRTAATMASRMLFARAVSVFIDEATRAGTQP